MTMQEAFGDTWSGVFRNVSMGRVLALGWSISTADKRLRLHGGQRGVADTKAQAVLALETEFTDYIANTDKFRILRTS